MTDFKIRKPIATFKRDYNPIKDDPNWSTNSDRPTELWSDAQGIWQNPTNDVAFVSYGSIYGLDVKLGCTLKVLPWVGSDLATAVLAVRSNGVTDGIGVRYISGQIVVYESSGGSDVVLSGADQILLGDLVDPYITLEVVGDTVFLGVNKDLYEMPVKATILTAGFIGIIQSIYTGASPVLMIKGFSILSYTM